jgi:hypothetical protein
MPTIRGKYLFSDGISRAQRRNQLTGDRIGGGILRDPNGIHGGRLLW